MKTAIENWNKTKNILRKSIHSEGFSPVDTVRVRIAEHDEYLQELSQNKQLRKIDDAYQEFKIIKFTPEQLLDRKLIYDNNFLKLNGNIADTSNQTSKDKIGVQMFVMSKEGNIYIENHQNFLFIDNENINHGSLLDDKPVEMAGLIGITNGKITYISNESGHYKPQDLDIYRGIKHLLKIMPHALDKNCVISIKGKYSLNINDFISSMEEIQKNGKPLHENLRNLRIDRYKNYKKKLQTKAFINAIRINDDKTFNDLINVVNKDYILATSMKNQDHQVTKKLIDRVDEDGNSLLIKSIKQDNLDLMNLLLSNGANTSIKNNNGETFFDLFMPKRIEYISKNPEDFIKFITDYNRQTLSETQKEDTINLLKNLCENTKILSEIIKILLEKNNNRAISNIMTIAGYNTEQFKTIIKTIQDVKSTIPASHKPKNLVQLTSGGLTNTRVRNLTTNNIPSNSTHYK
jgi:hypothetical protein